MTTLITAAKETTTLSVRRISLMRTKGDDFVLTQVHSDIKFTFVYNSAVKRMHVTSVMSLDFHGGGTLGISGWGCAARTLEPLAYTRASFSWILLPYTRANSWFP